MVFKENHAPCRFIFGIRPCAPPLQRVHVTKENSDKAADGTPQSPCRSSTPLFLRREAVAVTTEVQEEILREMGIDPSFGIACVRKVNVVYENDMDLMIKLYKFVAK
ncbi:hypothetical protein ZWY2020_024848 [Hordeum vulgare]|nr:hypothetical protein ZWY2020_024848 [Hordeum vulgare]